MTTTNTGSTSTARQRAIDALRYAGEEGLSKAQLREAVGGNAGAFRRLLQSMEDKGELFVREENRPTCGLTKVHTLGKVE